MHGCYLETLKHRETSAIPRWLETKTPTQKLKVYDTLINYVLGLCLHRLYFFFFQSSSNRILALWCFKTDNTLYTTEEHNVLEDSITSSSSSIYLQIPFILTHRPPHTTWKQTGTFLTGASQIWLPERAQCGQLWSGVFFTKPKCKSSPRRAGCALWLWQKCASGSYGWALALCHSSLSYKMAVFWFLFFFSGPMLYKRRNYCFQWRYHMLLFLRIQRRTRN